MKYSLHSRKSHQFDARCTDKSCCMENKTPARFTGRAFCRRDYSKGLIVEVVDHQVFGHLYFSVEALCHDFILDGIDIGIADRRQV